MLRPIIPDETSAIIAEKDCFYLLCENKVKFRLLSILVGCANVNDNAVFTKRLNTKRFLCDGAESF